MEKSLPEGVIKIIDGPSKFDLMCSLFDGKVVQITCDFNWRDQNRKIKIAPRLQVVFQKVGIEDGSRESWIGELYFCDANYQNQKKNFYYNSKKRTGTIN